ncbi:helix-turn-helix domain-containing protein [Lentzea sp. NPDC060358]|uniref:helix-turn-helix domain-containing protein n=1 Tax=Lentzea sp. NPDC060358 TaxID=3347103 RepID=UPI00364744E6
MVDQLQGGPALLRYFRTSAGLVRETVAAELNVSQSTLFNWENGRTEGLDRDRLVALDALYGAGGVLRDLYLALRTPDALLPTEQWWHNYQGLSRPCWVWLRTADGRPGTAQVIAGPFMADCEIPAEDGVFLQVYASAPNPAVHVRIDGGGWADFGAGVIPANIGARVLNAVDLAVVGSRDNPDNALVVAARSWLPHTEYKGQSGWFALMKERLGEQAERTRTTFAAAAKAVVSTRTDVSAVPASLDEVQRHWGGDSYRRLREARGLSLKDTADLASKLDTSLPQISKDHVRRLELGSAPRVPQLLERLDATLGADGRTCTVEVTGIETTGGFTKVTFPTYWIGPVWVQFVCIGQAKDNSATLLWSPWCKTLTLSHGVVVTTRRSEPSQPPLRIKLPTGWEIRAGVGVHPRAVDVQTGWGLINADLGIAALRRYFAVVRQVFDGARHHR